MEIRKFCWKSSTNWTAASGSLVNSVAVESFATPFDDDDTSTADSKSPLILRPPSLDSGPCEITINFEQKHEVRQVYVRSTARVFEIYYATSSKSSNEYLCTVRCGVATRDEDVLQANYSENVKEGSGDLDLGNSKTCSNSSTCDDDWVEVKVPGFPAFDNRNISLPLKSTTDLSRIRQDFYEATAELTDTDPCTSLTLRLLSLQSKISVCVDEVYVFADPVDSDESEKEEGHVGSSAGSSLMTMLVPTLLKFSKTTSVNRTSDRPTSNPEKKCVQERPLAVDSTKHETKAEEERKCRLTDYKNVNLEELKGTKMAPELSQIHLQAPMKERQHDYAPRSHIETTLNQLVSRMQKMEDFFVRFEENMVKPINSIEARLQRVEQQLEVMNQKPQNSSVPSFSRISAPEFSCSESDTNSLHNSATFHNLNDGTNDSDKRENPSPLIPVPGLVVTAPDFSNCDDEDQNLTLESVKNSPEVKRPKSVFSIDDALASALAGFVFSSSVQSSRYSPSLTVKAPEFSNEENDNDYSEIQSEPQSLEEKSCSNGWDVIKNAITENINQITDVQVLDNGSIIQDQPFENPTHEDPDNRSIIPDRSIESQTDEEDCDNDATEVAVSKEVPKEKSIEDNVHTILGFSPTSSTVNFELSVLDVKFASLGNNSNTMNPLDILFDSSFEAPSIKDNNDDDSVSKESNFILVEEEDEESKGTKKSDPFFVDPTNYNDKMMDGSLSINGEDLAGHDDFPCSHETFTESLI